MRCPARRQSRASGQGKVKGRSEEGESKSHAMHSFSDNGLAAWATRHGTPPSDHQLPTAAAEPHECEGPQEWQKRAASD